MEISSIPPPLPPPPPPLNVPDVVIDEVPTPKCGKEIKNEQEGKLKATPTPSPRESGSGGSQSCPPTPSPRYSEISTRQLNKPSNIVTRAEAYEGGENSPDSYTMMSALIAKVLLVRFSAKAGRRAPSSEAMFNIYRGITFCWTVMVGISVVTMLLHVVDMGESCCTDTGPTNLEVGYVYNFSFPKDCSVAQLPQGCSDQPFFDKHCGDDALIKVFNHHAASISGTLVAYCVILLILIIVSWIEMINRRCHGMLQLFTFCLNISSIICLAITSQKTERSMVGCDYWSSLDKKSPSINKAILRDCLDLVNSCGNRLSWIITNINANGYHSGWVVGMVALPLNAFFQSIRYLAGFKCFVGLASFQ